MDIISGSVLMLWSKTEQFYARSLKIQIAKVWAFLRHRVDTCQLHNDRWSSLFADLFMPLDCDFVDKPLLVLGRVIDRLMFTDVVGHIQFVSIERPWDEDYLTLLVVEWKVLHVQSTVGLDDSRKHPQHLTTWWYDSKCIHEVLETVVSTAT